MGAGASTATGLSMDKRREMYETLKDQYTKADLDDLAAEEKQAWLEVCEERENGTSSGVAVDQALTYDIIDSRDVAQEPPEYFQRASLADAVAAAAAAAAITAGTAQDPHADGNLDLNSNRNSGADDGSGSIRPQTKAKRLSCHLPPESDESDEGKGEELSIDYATIVQGDGGDGEEENDEDGHGDWPEGREGGGAKKARRSSCGTSEVPAWRRVAEKVETACELCVGDVVRARDKDCGGMWFEGVLIAIHDACTFTVEMASETDKDNIEYITVGTDDITRIMPWYCIEVGDTVECQPEGGIAWSRGKVVRILHSRGCYIVRLEESTSDGDGEANNSDKELLEVSESRVRKVSSGRSAATRRWKKLFHTQVAARALAR